MGRYRWCTRALVPIVTAGATITLAASQLADPSADLVREPAIAYFTRPTTDLVVRLQHQIADGARQLPFDPAFGYLRPVLDALGVPIESQILVYSKSSVQSLRINPRNPRAIYFNDTVAV